MDLSKDQLNIKKENDIEADNNKENVGKSRDDKIIMLVIGLLCSI